MITQMDVAALDWLARVGGAAQEDIARALGVASGRSVQRRLRLLEAAGLVRQIRLLHQQPALWLATAAGMRMASRGALAVSSVSASGYMHMLECGRVAATLEQGLGATMTLCSERELRAWERAVDGPLASAELGLAADGALALHRPDMVVWNGAGQAVAVEVELTCKAPRRLRGIVRGWARSRCVAGIVYLCSADAGRGVRRAVEAEWAQDRIDVLALGRWAPVDVEARFAGTGNVPDAGSKSFVPSRA